jgi:glutamate synthase (ferredoxin)
VGRAAERSGDHVLLGNVALYGATAGKLFAAGRAGERFAVRNSGAITVVEGIGDHGCEYMTGGVVVILGEIGINFGAGMTGGLAWVFDSDGDIVAKTRYHEDFLEAVAFDACTPEEQASLRELLDEHVRLTDSVLARGMLSEWESAAKEFVLFRPKPQA